jgi:hypothetical protein
VCVFGILFVNLTKIRVMAAIFSTNSLDQAKSDFNRVKLEADQSKILDDTAKIIEPHMEINSLALKGFMLRAIKQWQSAENMALGDLVTAKPEVRIKQMAAMFNNLKGILTKALVKQTDKEAVEKAVDGAFENYKEKYAYR